MYPPGTNHFNPHSPLFKEYQRASRALYERRRYYRVLITRFIGNSILLSDIGVASMVSLLIYAARHVGWTAVGMYYFVPYLVRLGFLIGRLWC